MTSPRLKEATDGIKTVSGISNSLIGEVEMSHRQSSPSVNKSINEQNRRRRSLCASENREYVRYFHKFDKLECHICNASKNP